MDSKITGYTLKVSALAAALKCAGVDDVRYYLNGVYVDFPEGRIVGTDGHRAFVGEIPRADCSPVILPRELCERIVKANRGVKLRDGRDTAAVFLTVGEPVIVQDKEPARRVTVSHPLAGATLEALEVIARFPEYMRVIPRKVDGVPCGYNADYIAEAGEALSLYAERDKSKSAFFNWHFNGNSGGLFTLAGVPALVVIMPLRDVATPDTAEALAWLDKPTMPPAVLGDVEPEAEAEAEPAADVLTVETLGGVALGTVPGPDFAAGEHIVLETVDAEADPLS